MRPDFFDETKETNWLVIVVFSLLHVGYTLLVWNFLIDWQGAKIIAQYTGGFIQPTLLYNIIPLLLIVGGAILWAGKLRRQDIGLVFSGLPRAVVVTLGAWAIVQLVLVIASLVAHSPILLHSIWESPGVLFLIGALIAQLFGNALYEELAFRGFLLPQMYLKFKSAAGKNSAKHLFLAVLVSQLFFALIHIPALWFNGGNMIPALVSAGFGGIFLSLIYLRTGNLLIAVGLHALMNRPTPIIDPLFPPQIVIGSIMILLILSWPTFERKISRPALEMSESRV